MSEVELDDPTNDEATRLLSWRFKVFGDLGFATEQALELAESKADLHLASKLVRKGCELETVRRIVL